MPYGIESLLKIYETAKQFSFVSVGNIYLSIRVRKEKINYDLLFEIPLGIQFVRDVINSDF